MNLLCRNQHGCNAVEKSSDIELFVGLTPAKPHHAGEAYNNLASVTKRKIDFIALSQRLCDYKILSAYKVCALGCR